jgi:hypothetical protein
MHTAVENIKNKLEVKKKINDKCLYFVIAFILPET